MDNLRKEISRTHGATCSLLFRPAGRVAWAAERGVLEVGRGKAWKETSLSQNTPRDPTRGCVGRVRGEGSPGRACRVVFPKRMCPHLSLESVKGALFGKASLQTFKLRILT